MRHMDRSAPESQGVNRDSIIKFIEALNIDDVREELHSAMVLRHGKVIAEFYNAPYDKDISQETYSLSKSFTSIAIGIAVSEGLLKLEDRLVDFFLDEDFMNVEGPIYNRYKEVTVKHLLTMTEGQGRDFFMGPDAFKKTDWVKAYFDIPLSRKPGDKFAYNTGASYMLAVVLEKSTGVRLDAYLNERLFEPLGFGQWFWLTCPRGYNVGGYGLNVLTEDIAKFGQCLLDNGRWEGKQLIPEDWIEEATSYQVATEEEEEAGYKQGGYGYQFWMESGTAFRADGAFGQVCLVVPEEDAVVVVTSGRRTTRTVTDAVWNVLIPGMLEPTDLKKNVLEEKHLSEKEADSGSINLVQTAPGLMDLNEPFDELKGCYQLDKTILGFDRLHMNVEPERLQFILEGSKGQLLFDSDKNNYMDNKVPYHGQMTLAKSRAFKTNNNEVTVLNRVIMTPHVDILKFVYEGNEVIITLDRNVDFGDLEPVIVRGRRI